MIQFLKMHLPFGSSVIKEELIILLMFLKTN